MLSITRNETKMFVIVTQSVVISLNYQISLPADALRSDN